MRRVVVTGANRGLGLAFTAALLARGDLVCAVCRPGADFNSLDALAASAGARLRQFPLDMRASETFPALYEAVQSQLEGLDLLINNAGILTDHETLSNVQLDSLLENYRVNTVAPLLLTQQLLPLLQRGRQPLIVNISSSFASIGRKTAAMPARYSYSMSKAALNMFTKTAAGELAPLGIAVVALHPGWTRTRIGGAEARFSPEEAAQAALQTLDQLTPAQSGSYLTWDGKELPW
jgi:NAD(P)-dependent dehydrogenase (short-subunit alcohol dehydrogenase family)